jgi:hypothetical protein
VTWTFDRASGSLRVNRRRFSTGRTISYPLDEIVSASVWSGLVTLGLTSGQRLLLSSAHAHEAVHQICAFLGIPSEPAPAAQGGPIAERGSPDVFASPSPGGERAGPERPPSLPSPGGEGAATYRSFRDRLAGVVLFRASAYRAVAEDPAARRSALTIVLSVAALVGFVSGMTSHGMLVNGRSLPPGPLHGAARMVIEICAGLVSWRASAAVGSFVARVLFRGRTDTSEMLRVLGYAGVFRFLCVLPYGSAPAWLLSTAGTVIAMREAAEFDTRRAFITAAITWVIAFAVSSIVWLLLSLVVMSFATPLG